MVYIWKDTYIICALCNTLNFVPQEIATKCVLVFTDDNLSKTINFNSVLKELQLIWNIMNLKLLTLVQKGDKTCC